MNSLAEVYEVLDEKIDAVRQSLESYYRICKRGCADCCKVNWVACTSQEWALVFDALVQWPLLDQRRLIERTKVLVQEFYAKPGAREGIEKAAAASGADALRIMKDVLDNIRLPCPLLTPDNACSVYSVRPTICRAYGFACIDQKKFLICEKLKEKLTVAQKEGQAVRLPLYEQFRIPILQLDGEPLVVMALPFWINRFNDGQKIADVNNQMPGFVQKWNSPVFV